ncbi:hydroxypyruvate isomerase family protein [Limimaricola pyoseonensis]|uniref:Hydroxypyruvate isomerase n=1 Tax=Limimaricola pyoseonensis TaxID=521013 RepID=A0A1G7J575_9RHOB|nr:TIM barrel protein [Limimaricola pyoseonensis]SDF20080.1 hydroxypyruvate isomerase [Limimaricola pyoseonensis]
MGFSANLGFLFTEHALPDAVRAAARAGFAAIECHEPYATDPGALRAVLDETGLPLIGLNARRGDAARGEFGLAALAGREADARDAIAEAVIYAAEAGAGFVHVLAGRSGGGAAAETVFREALAFACDLAGEAGIGVLIEPINRRDVPGYHIAHADAAGETIAALGRPNLKLMYDCYHAGMAGRDIRADLAAHLDHLGHVQIAALPDRGEPDRGEIDYAALLADLRGLGWSRPVGAEYRPRAGWTEEGLGWLSAFPAEA